jgi:hypothetical protein
MSNKWTNYFEFYIERMSSYPLSIQVVVVERTINYAHYKSLSILFKEIINDKET